MVVLAVSLGKRNLGLGNTKIPCQPSTNGNFIYVTLVDLYHQFYFGDTKNDPSNVDLTRKDNSLGVSGKNAMILAKLSRRDRVSPADI